MNKPPIILSWVDRKGGNREKQNGCRPFYGVQYEMQVHGLLS